MTCNQLGKSEREIRNLGSGFNGKGGKYLRKGGEESIKRNKREDEEARQRGLESLRDRALRIGGFRIGGSLCVRILK